MTLRILSVAYPFAPVGEDAVGGAEQVLAQIDAGLTASGHRSFVIACEGSRVAGALTPIPFPSGAIDSAAREHAYARVRHALADIAWRERVDLVHLHGVDFAEYAPKHVPVLVTLHLPLAWYPESSWRSAGRLFFNCVSETQMRDFRSVADLLPPIPNGVALEKLETRHAKRNFALMLARICPEKGIHLGLDAARAAALPCLLAGQLYPYEAHQRYFEEEVAPRLGSAARFIGALNLVRKRRFLTAARCVLIPSLAPETASLVAMEAAACGSPVIAFPNGALVDTVEHGRTGFLVPNVGEMAEAIRFAHLVDPDTCRATARQRFSATAMVERYIALYRELILKKQSDRPVAA